MACSCFRSFNMSSSSSSSVTPSQLIDYILKTQADKPDFDLSQFVEQIDHLYAQYEAQLNPIGEKLGELPSASEASSFGEQVSTIVNQIANEIKEYSGDKHETTIAILKAIGNVHWSAVGFLVVGATLKIANTIKDNKEECLRLFKSMIDLSKIILQLQVLFDLQKELHAKLNESIQLIVKGAILCCSQKKRKRLKREFKASRDRQELQQLSNDMDHMREMLHLKISTSTTVDNDVGVGNVKSLWRLDIVGSEKLIPPWMQMKSQKERNPVVVTDFPQGEEGKKALFLEGVLSNVFDEEGLLVDADERPFHSSPLQPRTPLILIIDSECGGWWKGLGKKLRQLQCNSKELQIIYVGTHFKSINSESAVIRFLAYTPDNTRTSSFCHKLFASFDRFDSSGIAVFRSTDQLEENGLRCLSAWEDISKREILDELALLANTPRESNIELLKELLVTEETDHLLLNGNHEVKVAALQGKLILLLVTYLDETLEVRTLAAAVKEMYLKMQESHNYAVELVWVPIIGPWSNTTWEDFERAAANAPWPVVPNPWLIQERILSFFGWSLEMPCVCVVDEKGRILKKDAMALIERWGVQAYPFSQAREEEVRKAEWEGFKVNSLSTLQFVFQNLEFLSNKVKEMVDRGVMMLFCVGSPKKMMELARHLNSAFTMLKMDFQLFYVAHSEIIYRKDYDMACEKLKENESEMRGITTFPLSDIYRFWRRVKHLQNELMNGMGTEERIVKVRRMVLGLASADCKYWRMSIVVVDGNGEMFSGRGMGLVEAPCDGEEESKEKLVEEIKKGGVEKRVESRWRDGIIHPKHQCNVGSAWKSSDQR